jgi:hypothetical protein
LFTGLAWVNLNKDGSRDVSRIPQSKIVRESLDKRGCFVHNMICFSRISIR